MSFKDYSFKNLKQYSENILTDAIMYNQIPISSESTDSQKEFIINRLNEYEVPKIERDEAGNIFVEYFQSKNLAKDTILILTPIKYKKISRHERFVRLDSSKAYGKGLIENSLKVSVILNLINYLFNENHNLNYNITFLFTDISDIEQNFRSLNYYLENTDSNILFAIDIDSTSLGDIGSKSLGKYRYKIKVKTEQIDLINICEAPNKLSAMDILTEIGARLKIIGWPEESCTFINIIDISSDSKEEVISDEGVMKIELLSRKSQYLEYENQILNSTVKKLSRELNTDIDLELIGYSPANYIMEKSPLIDIILEVHEELDIKSKFRVIRDEAAVLLQTDIPTVSLGITNGKLTVNEEYIEKEPITKGIIQLFLIIEKGANYFKKKEEDD
ncbi:MAG: hypothetical protein FXF47_00645 [Candidatus Mcinerneyibacterium aminivorans]|uniref:Peptidase M20 dimerisation domain-containing protein n=1 Tax=Candidatus Mcinerneyibacterium aminivorans TaxID=2703815 RepID=A0A5D0MEL1_9BACT|nr:MAG: hypothetical protein FXF47_00645 [Candidatus Mcinerneyibacterium aminivorans]